MILFVLPPTLHTSQADQCRTSPEETLSTSSEIRNSLVANRVVSDNIQS